MKSHLKKLNFLIGCKHFNIRDALFNYKIKNANILSAGYSLYEWQNTNVYCGSCGSKNNIRDNGNSLICKNKKCNRKIFLQLIQL